MATRKKKTWTRRTDDEKRAILAMRKNDESLAALSRRTGVHVGQLSEWIKGLPQIRKIATLPEAPVSNGHGALAGGFAAPKVQVTGLLEAVLEELKPTIQAALPRAITMAMAKAFTEGTETEE